MTNGTQRVLATALLTMGFGVATPPAQAGEFVVDGIVTADTTNDVVSGMFIRIANPNDTVVNLDFTVLHRTSETATGSGTVEAWTAVANQPETVSIPARGRFVLNVSDIGPAFSSTLCGPDAATTLLCTIAAVHGAWDDSATVDSAGTVARIEPLEVYLFSFTGQQDGSGDIIQLLTSGMTRVQ